MASQVFTNTPLQKLNRAGQVACMTRALFAAIGGEDAGGLQTEDLNWLSFLGCELAAEMVALIDGLDLAVGRGTGEAP